nr:uncharacterized protein LOC125418899 [Ziziphus jujuba var. spinosa]
MNEAWERFKDLLRKCPQHGYDEWVLIDLFYNSLNGHTNTIVDSTTCGSLMAKTVDEAYALLEEMASSSFSWPIERQMGRRPIDVHEVNVFTNLTANSSMDPTSSMSFPMGEQSQEQCSFVEQNWNYNFRLTNNLPNYYHSRLRNHQNFSYGNPRNALNPPSSFQKPKEDKPSMEDLITSMNSFILETRGRLNKDEARLNSIETDCASMGATMKSLEHQIGQLANQIKGKSVGKFPSDTEANLRECKAITTRSGKVYQGPTPSNSVSQEKMVDKESSKVEEVKDDQANEGDEDFSFNGDLKKKESTKVCLGSIPFTNNLPLLPTPLPYPQRFRKKNLDSQFAKFLEIFKKIHINILFADALEQMPNYAKLMKELMSNKRKWDDNETVKLTEGCSMIIQRKIP